MTRSYAFLSLLIITGALCPLSLAQDPAPQSPTINRQSFLAEIIRQRLSPPVTTGAVEPAEEPILRIKTVVLRLPDPNAGLDKSGFCSENLSGLYETALFQRQRFRETGQPIEFERRNLFFRQDRFVVTKGLILRRARNDRIDFGLYQRSFHNEASPGRARELRSGPLSRENDHGDERQYYFGVRFRLGKASKYRER